MSCFSWQTKLSDVLDGTLGLAERPQIEEHLNQCASCQEQHRHYLQIIQRLSTSPRASLPVEFRHSKTGLHVSLPRTLSERIARIPIAIRWLTETGLLIGFLAFLIVAGAQVLNPQTATSDSFQEETIGTAPSNPSQILALGIRTKPGTSSPSEDHPDGAEFEDEGEVVAAHNNPSSDGTIYEAGSSEIWRFYLKTESPEDLKAKILEIVRPFERPEYTDAGSHGMEVPGGIQFDLLIPQNRVGELKTAIEQLAPRNADATHDEGTPLEERFTWYRKKSRQRLPQGQTRVIIWLSQL